MVRVDIQPQMMQWARERAGLSQEALESRFPSLISWENGTKRPTLRQLEDFAKATYVPIGYFFLPQPPIETVPIPDFRTMRGQAVRRPSPNLLDTIYACQERQDWYRDYARGTGAEPVAIVGSMTLQTPITQAANIIRQTLGIDLAERNQCRTWIEALRLLISQAERVGVLVMCNGVVGNNNHRKLDPQEFRGFALVDSHAPLVFVNGADSKSAQMFTLIHELAHIWLGRSALSDVTPATRQGNEIETWCNRVAAEVLVPLDLIQREATVDVALPEVVGRLVRQFKVSSLVILQRLRDARVLTWAQFDAAYNSELKRLGAIRVGSGGDFYLTAISRYSRRFTRALVESTLEGNTLYKDAFRLLGISKSETLRSLGDDLVFGS